MIEEATNEAETLNVTIARAAESWDDSTLDTIITGLLAQRERWNVEQVKGSRKRVASNKVTVKKSTKPPKAKFKKGASLKKIIL